MVGNYQIVWGVCELNDGFVRFNEEELLVSKTKMKQTETNKKLKGIEKKIWKQFKTIEKNWKEWKDCHKNKKKLVKKIEIVLEYSFLFECFLELTKQWKLNILVDFIFGKEEKKQWKLIYSKNIFCFLENLKMCYLSVEFLFLFFVFWIT